MDFNNDFNFDNLDGFLEKGFPEMGQFSPSEKKRVMLLEKGNSYLVSSLRQKLEEQHLVIVMPDANVTSISHIEGCSALLIYSSTELLSDKELFTFLSDYTSENEMMVYAIGNKDELNIIHEYFADNVYKKDFLRPIKVDQIASMLDMDLMMEEMNPTKKILVVDDSGPMLRKIKGWLEGKYKITLANSGARAMKALGLSIPDLVLLDYEMPIVDGKQVLEMMRADPDYKDIPVIFLTGKSDKQAVLDVMALKPAGYLLKTEDPDTIINQIDTFFSTGKLF